MADNYGLTIQADSEVEIHFMSHIDDLQKFFSQEIDNNMGNLQSIDFTHFDSSMVTNMNSIFYGCSSLELINLSNIETSSITDMNSMFYGCNSLISINLADFDTSNVKNMSCMFSECNSLKSLNLSNFITSSITDMSKMFYNCNSLNLLDISNFDMRGINNDISNDMFANIDQLKYFNIFNVQDNNIISRSSLNKKNDLIFCQKNIIIDNHMALNICCDYNIEKDICEGYTDFERIKEIHDLKLYMLNESYKGENIIIEKESYSMKLSKLQLSKLNDQISNIELFECEKRLKAANNIDQNEDLMVFEIDFKTKDLSSTYIYYEIYDSSLKRLDLNICNDVKINLYPPVIFDESLINLIEKTSQLGYNIFNESDSFYNDICTKFTTENGTDILLSDRKKDIFTQTLNKSICQIGCEFESYNTKSKKAKCNCEVSKDSISEIISLNIDDLFNKKSIGENFYSTLANSNFRVMKCYYIAFDPSNFPRNYGKTFMTILLISFGITMIIYFIKGIIQIDKLLSTILELIKENNSNDKNEDIDRKDEKNIYKIEGQKDEDKIIQKTIEYAEGNISNPPPPKKIKKNKSKVNTFSKMLNTNSDNDNIIQRRNKKRITKEKVTQKNGLNPEIKIEKIENILNENLCTENNIYETEKKKKKQIKTLLQ